MMAERVPRKDRLPSWVADLHLSMLTYIGLQLRQQLDAPEQLSPDLAALLTHEINELEETPRTKT